jgi:glutathione S-transferase
MVVHWMLIELDIPHQLKLVDTANGEQKSEAYLRLNPAGLVPTLVIDGTPLTEAAALVMHLADSQSIAGLAPALGTVARAQYNQWMFFCANTLQPAYRNWFYPDQAPGGVDAVKLHTQQTIESAWARVEKHLQSNGPFLLGDKVTAADFLLCMLMRWSRNMPLPAHTLPALGVHASKMKARPSFKLLYQREGLTEWA